MCCRLQVSEEEAEAIREQYVQEMQAKYLDEGVRKREALENKVLEALNKLPVEGEKPRGRSFEDMEDDEDDDEIYREDL